MKQERFFSPPRLVCTAILFFFSASVLAQSSPVLTLEQALKTIDAPHPDLQIAQAERDLARADQASVSARRDLSVSLEGRLQRVKPASSGSNFITDNSVRLAARKNLFDFGRSDNAEGAARAVVEARDLDWMDVREQRRIDIMQRYFDVLLADLQYTADNEYMAVAYVTLDNAVSRMASEAQSKSATATPDAGVARGCHEPTRTVGIRFGRP
jgi:outer membrane protein TolC